MMFTPESPSKFSARLMSLSSTSFLFLTAEQTHTHSTNYCDYT